MRSSSLQAISKGTLAGASPMFRYSRCKKVHRGTVSKRFPREAFKATSTKQTTLGFAVIPRSATHKGYPWCVSNTDKHWPEFERREDRIYYVRVHRTPRKTFLFGYRCSLRPSPIRTSRRYLFVKIRAWFASHPLVIGAFTRNARRKEVSPTANGAMFLWK